MLPLSAKQVQVLEALRCFEEREARVPSVRELAREVGLSCSTTHQHLRALERKGMLTMDGTAHGIHLRGRRSRGVSALVEVPLVGTIAAGAPIEAVEIPEDPFLLPSRIATAGCYALRVRGDSMIDDHILDGDFIVVRPQKTVERGEIAVALLDDGTATLKRVYREASQVRLQPANPRLEPLYVQNVTIQGKVVAVIRLPA